MTNSFCQSQAPAQFAGRNGALLFDSGPRTVNDFQKFTVGAQLYRFFVRVPNGDHRRERLAPFDDNDGFVSCLFAYSDNGPEAFASSAPGILTPGYI
jgi:hypothetical protein